MPDSVGRVLITGISGFVGCHLCEELLRKGWSVLGLIREGEDVSKLDAVIGEVEFLHGDLTDGASLERAVGTAKADAVAHLAAESAPSKSFAEPERFFEINALGTLRLLEALRLSGKRTRIIILSSAEVYGAIDPSLLPITESAPLRPANPYAASKAACHYIARQYVHHFGMEIVEARPFNMIGPRQDLGFVLPDFAAQAAEIVKGRREPAMKVGRLSDERDFVDIRDAVRAVAELMERGAGGEVYHICSGSATPVQRLLDRLLAETGMKINVVQDPARLRPAKVPVMLGSHEKLTALTGWQPTIPLETTIHDVFNYWMSRTD